MKKFNKDRVKKAQYGLKFDYDINKPISNMNAGMDKIDFDFLKNAAFSNYNGFKFPWGNVGFATYTRSEKPVKDTHITNDDTVPKPIMDKLMQVNRNNGNATDVLNDLLNQPYKEVVGTGNGSGSESDARELEGVEVTAPALIKKPQAPSVKLNIPKPNLTAPRPFDENANRRHLDLLRKKVYRKGILGYNGLTDEGKKFHGYVQGLLKDKDIATTNVEDILKGDDLLTWKILHGDKGFADANFNGWDGKVGQLDDDLQSWKDRYMKSVSPTEKPVVEPVKVEAPVKVEEPAVEPEGAAEPNQIVTATTRRSGRGSTKSAAQLQKERAKRQAEAAKRKEAQAKAKAAEKAKRKDLETRLVLELAKAYLAKKEQEAKRRADGLANRKVAEEAKRREELAKNKPKQGLDYVRPNKNQNTQKAKLNLDGSVTDENGKYWAPNTYPKPIINGSESYFPPQKNKVTITNG